MVPYKQITLFLIFAVLVLSVNAQKTMQNYLYSADPAANDSAVTAGIPTNTPSPYVIVGDEEIEPYNEDPPIPDEMSFGDMPYTIETTSSGQVHLNIPINNYASDNEFAPLLSLDYNSGRNSFDVLGKGWIIKGLPVITRVAKNYFTDSNVEGISLTDNYSFSLNGERLIYQEESVDTIRFLGQTSNTKVLFVENERFNVLFTDGSVATMNSTDGINYCITALTQKDGQVINYIYDDPHGCGNGHKYISSIYYGGKRITFEYISTNDDRIDYYCAGKLFKLRTKLNHIRVYEGNELITRYQLLSGNKTDSPLQEVTQIFKGGKHFTPMRLSYLYQSIPHQGYSKDTAQLSIFPYNTNPEDYVIQKGKFSHHSEGEGFLMFKNKDSYYYDEIHVKVRNENNPNDLILIASNSDTGFLGYVPGSFLIMNEGFVDAFTINTDSIHGEEIVKINNWKPSNSDELINVNIYSVNSPGTTFKNSFNIQSFYGNNYSSIMPKTFLTGDFDGDGINELLMVEHNIYSSSYNTPFKIVNFNNGQTEFEGMFEEYINVIFPSKIGNQPLDSQTRWNNYKNSDRLFTLDYNGDGKTEIGVINSSGFKIYEFYYNQSGGITMRSLCNNSFPKLSDLKDYGLRIGEFNGDGYADILLYLETDTSINPQIQKLFKTYLGKGNGFFALKDSIQIQNNSILPYNALLQANMDGTTDIIMRGKPLNSSTNSLKVIKIRYGKFNSSYSFLFPDSVEIVPAYFYGECNIGGILAVGKNGVLFKYKNIIPTDAIWKLSDISDIYNNRYKINYRRMFESDGYHPDFYRYQFPYTIFAKGQLACHSMKKYDSMNNIVEDKYFDYGNAVMHEQGLGYLGFDIINVIDSISERTQTTNYDILKLGVPSRIENHKSINNFYNTLIVTNDKRLLSRQNAMSHFDKATNCSDSTSYTYDQYGNVTQEHTFYQEGQEKAVNTQYINLSNDTINIIGLPSKVTNTVTNANGSVVSGTKYLYNDDCLLTSEKQFFGNENQIKSERQLVYDWNNRIITEKKRNFNSEWLVCGFDYDDNSNKPSCISDVRGINYEIAYDKFGIKRIHEDHASAGITPAIPAGGLQGDEINGGGLVIIPDPEPSIIPNSTLYERDEAGNVTCVTETDKIKHITNRTWLYNAIDIAAKFFVTDSITGQPVTRTYYNSLGQKTRVETQRPDSSYLKVDYEYDMLGRLVKQYEPYKTNKTLFTSFIYDDFDRVVSKTYPDGHSDTFSYNGLTTTSNEGGITSSRTVDALGNLVSVTDPGGIITYSMTADGRPLSVNVNGEASTTFEYDSYGRKTALNDPSSGRTTYTYDNAGNVSSVTDARGKITTTSYNKHGMPTSCTIGSDITVTYSYNDFLQPTTVTCSNGNSKLYTYNKKNHLLTSETINGFKKSYNYSGGVVASIGYSLDGTSLGTEHYTRNRGTVTAISYGGKTLWQLDSEDNHAMPTAISSSATSTELEYDDLHRVTSRIAETNSFGTIHDMQYEYDTYGNMTYREDGNWSNYEDFEYDNLNRLISTPEGDMTYDGKGNITAHDAAGAFSYASSKPYALSQIALAVTDFPTATQTITYNSMNRPDTVSEGSVTARFKYFEDGERSQMIVSGSNCYNVHKYFGTQFTTLDLNEQGYEGQKQILFLGGDAYTAQAALVREKLSGSSTWSQSLYYIVRDNLGSITQVVDSTGMVAQELSYDAWGRLRDPETLQPYAPNSQPNLLLGRGFCGHEHLTKFNLINMNARLYDPWASRFLSPDPYVQLPDFTQSLNRYSYCWNNPLSRIDLSGLDSWYTNDKNEILAFLNEYKRRRGLFPGSSMEDWLNNRSGWEYEGEGLNRIDLDRMRLYTTYSSFSGSNFYAVDETHINMSELTVNSYYYDLTYPSYSFNSFYAQPFTFEPIKKGVDFTSNITSPIGAGLATQNALWRSVGVESTFLKAAGKALAVPGTISSVLNCYNNYQEGQYIKSAINGVDIAVGALTIAGYLGGPWGIAASVAWYLVGDVIIYNLVE